MTSVANEASVEKKKIIVLGAGELPLHDCDPSTSLSGSNCIRCSGVDYCIEDSTARELCGYCSIGDNAERSSASIKYTSRWAVGCISLLIIVINQV